jgi:hypothetical protein
MLYLHAEGDGSSPSWLRFTVGPYILNEVEIAHRQIVDLQRSNSRPTNRKTADRDCAEGESANRNRAYGHRQERGRSRSCDLRWTDAGKHVHALARVSEVGQRAPGRDVPGRKVAAMSIFVC